VSPVATGRLAADLLRRPRAVAYGPAPSQVADLDLPRGAGPFPVAALVHGGSWGGRWSKVLMKGLAGDLVRRGWATWNVEYRRLGEDGGGWPGTLADVGAALDHLASLGDPRLDLAGGVTVIGHSAGGHLALWAASRERLPAGTPFPAPRVTVGLAVAQAGAVDLTRGFGVGGPVERLLGGTPSTAPERFAAADPARLLPPPCPVLLVHGTEDRTVGIANARRYAADARAAGADVELVELPGAAGVHRAHIDPRGAAWAAVTARLPAPVPTPSGA
jgi:acetyl esterase/lipase